MTGAIGALGLLALLALAYACSVDRACVQWRGVAVAMALQFAMALLALKTQFGAWLFTALNTATLAFIGAADRGIEFVFGRWPDQVMGPQGEVLELPFVFAIRVLPVIVFMSSVFAVLHHLGLLPLLVRVLARGLRRALPLSGAEALCAAGNIFLGMTEAPLMVRPYVADMTRSELFCVMTVGLATIAGSVLVAYAGMLGEGYVGHLVTASVMSAPAAIAYSKIIVPESGTPRSGAEAVGQLGAGRERVNVIDAAASGAAGWVPPLR